MEDLQNTPGQVHVYLFGAPRIEKAGQPVPLDTRKALAMFAYLAAGGSGSAASSTRDHLAALLYPESDSPSARAALRRTLSTLRKGIGSDCLASEGERIDLKLDCLWVDVLAFRALLRQIRAHEHSPTQVCQACLPLLEQCAALAEEEFLAGFSLRDSAEFDDWQMYQAEALRQERALVFEKLALGLAAQGDFEAALRFARRWLALDPLHEEAHRSLMRLYAWKGQRSAALRQYRACVRVLDQELGVAPLEETQRLYQELLENQVPHLPSLAGAGPLPESAVTRASPAPPAVGRGQDYPLVGRGAEMTTLQRAYANTGQAGFLFVIQGEAGIGKSRLAQDFLQYARAQGAEVMHARCYEGQAGLAYAPFLDGLNALLTRGQAAQRLNSLSPAVLSLVAQLAPALADLFPGLPAAPAAESPGIQVRFFDALRQVIQAWLAPAPPAASPGVLFLDDLHWADQASIDLLAYLARRLEGVFLLVAWRSGSVPPDHLLHHLLAQSKREQRGDSLHLDRLHPQDVAEMLQGVPARLPEHFVEHLYRETEGSPFFLVEYLAALQQNTVEPGSPAFQMPPGVRGLLQSHLDSAGELGRQMLSAAAVVGHSFDYAILHAVSGRSELEAIEGLEALLQQGLVVEQRPEAGAGSLPAQAGLSYDFSHDKLRSLVYDQASQARRQLLHKRAAEVHAARARLQPAAAGQAARHFQLAGLRLQGAEWYKRAGDYARAVYANHEAIVHFQNAIASGYADTYELQEAIGDLQVLSGKYAAALESYHAAAALCPSARLPWIEHKLGLVYDQRGEWDLAQCYFKSALEYLAEDPAGTGGSSAERSMIYADWSRTAYRRGDLEQARDLASQALELAEADPAGPALAQAYNNLGILARAAGSADAAIQYFQRSLEISKTLADPAREAAALNNLARVQAESGQIQAAIELANQALTICQQRGDRHREAALHTNLADIYHLAGQEETSMQHLTKSVIIMADIGSEPQGEPQPEIWKLVEW